MGYYLYDPSQAYRGYRQEPYYERDSYQRYFEVAPVAMRQEPYFDHSRRDYYRQGSSYDSMGRNGVVPLGDMFRRVEDPPWMHNQYSRGGQFGGYRIDRNDHHGGQGHGRQNFYHQGDDYRRLESGPHNSHHSSRTTVELYVPICCDKCERKLRKHLSYVEGVETITSDQTTKKVVVFGRVNPVNVLNRARQDKSESTFWNSHQR